MALSVAICDEENSICSELKKTLETILDKFETEHKIDIYCTSDDLWDKIESGKHYDLVFLDIEFSGSKINGVEVGKRIRDTYESDMVSIVYISREVKHSLQLFEVRPLNFLTKPLSLEKVEEVVKTFLKLSKLWANDFVYKVRNDVFKVKVKDIVYLESTKRKLTLHLADGSKEAFYGKLKEVYNEQLYKFDFLFIHASYIANIDYVSALKCNNVDLNYEGISLPISQRRKKEVKESYYSIMEKRGCYAL